MNTKPRLVFLKLQDLSSKQTKIMSRSSVPSRLQVNMLVETLEEKRWLGTGHARTLHARDRVRAGWEEVAAKLNSDRSGCLKNWQQWAKYWKDKKAAVKRKTIQIRTAKQQTGDDAAEEGLVLSPIEERIVAIMSSREPKLIPRRMIKRSPPSHRESYSELHNESHNESHSQSHNESHNESHSESQLASVTERLIAIEEKRLDNERLVIQNQQKMLDIVQTMSEAWTKQAQAMQDLCATVRRGT